MSDTYTQYAEVCAKFYTLTIDSQAVADFVLERTQSEANQSALFVGGMFDVAARMIERGLNLTVVDYTDEMVSVGKKALPNAQVLKADLRSLPFHSEFDRIFVVGRVFTHMLSNEELMAALDSCKQSLRPGGALFADNYETSRIQETKYFNGELSCSYARSSIVRRSTTDKLSSAPFIVDWKAEYTGNMLGKPFHFTDSMKHRAFSRIEFLLYLFERGFEKVEQGDNFDETSFYTVGRNQ